MQPMITQPSNSIMGWKPIMSDQSPNDKNNSLKALFTHPICGKHTKMFVEEALENTNTAIYNIHKFIFNKTSPKAIKIPHILLF